MSTGPDKRVALVGLDQSAKDRRWKQRIVDLDREVRCVVFADRRPGCADLDFACEDAEVGSFFAGLLDGLDLDLCPDEKGREEAGVIAVFLFGECSECRHFLFLSMFRRPLHAASMAT